VVRTPHHNILIDTCVGNDKNRPTHPFWHQMKSEAYMRNLAALGLGVGDIDFVMCTHLHVDHVGWNTRLENGRWVPSFPKARYLMGKREFEYWRDQTEKHDQQLIPWGHRVLRPHFLAAFHTAPTALLRAGPKSTNSPKKKYHCCGRH
jgi:glyoxylase-like metal-dependent hydrolase (beta-lactamase superfamily II)